MGFGTDLRDQLKEIDQYTSNGIQFLQEFQVYLKERIAIEQQYSQAVDKLAKSTIKKFKKSGQSFYGAGTPFTLGNAEAEGLGSCAQGFLKLLTEAENMAKARNVMAERMNGEVLQALKFEARRKEEARAKHMAFAAVLNKNFETQKAETDALRSSYRSNGKELDSAFAKYDKAPDEKTAEKAAKDWNEQFVEKMDRKHEYVISLCGLNSHKNSYYFREMPILMDHMQALNEHLIQRGREIMTEYIQIDNGFITEQQESNAALMDVVSRIQETDDTALFIQHVSKPWTEPPNFTFENYSEGEKGELSTDPSQVLLLNSLQKLMNDLDGHQKEMGKQTKDMEGMHTLKDAYSKDPNLGDWVEVWQNIIESERSLIQRETQKIKCEEQINLIRGTVGSVVIVGHQLKQTSSGNCVVCNQSISLFSKGLSCTACPIKFHVKCQAKVAPLCGTQVDPPAPRTPVGQGTPSLARKSTVRASSARSSRSQTAAQAVAAPSATLRGRVLYDFFGENPGDLQVREGEVIDVLDQDDGNGWATASYQGVQGAIPANYFELLDQSRTSSLNSIPAAVVASADRVRVLYDYDAQQAVEISIRAGDIIEVTNRGIGDGWLEGSLNGQVGQFPENYVEPI